MGLHIRYSTARLLRESNIIRDLMAYHAKLLRESIILAHSVSCRPIREETDGYV